MTMLSKHLGSIIGDSVIMCDETINPADSVSITVSTNANSTVPTNFKTKKHDLRWTVKFRTEFY